MKKNLFMITLSALLFSLLFACKPEPPLPDLEPEEFPADSAGSVFFYITKTFPCAEIQITLSGRGADRKNRLLGGSPLTAAPDCMQIPGLTYANMFWGRYNYVASCGLQTWSGEVVLDRKCVMIELK